VENIKLSEAFENYFTKNVMDNLFPECFPFLDGAGFILSRDVVDTFLFDATCENLFMNSDQTCVDFFLIPDDVLFAMLITRVFYEKKWNYSLINIQDCFKICNSIETPSEVSENVFFIRNRTDWLFGNRDIDILNFTNQIRFFYNRFDFV
jgi:hypothetical protein